MAREWPSNNLFYERSLRLTGHKTTHKHGLVHSQNTLCLLTVLNANTITVGGVTFTDVKKYFMHHFQPYC